MRYVWAIIASIAILMIFSVIKLFYGIVIKNYQEEHINELSKEVYVALGISEIIPLIIAVVLIRIVWKKITYQPHKKNSESDDSTSLTRAVYNHSKDIASEIKPAVDEYKQNHSSPKQAQTTTLNDIDEDKIYEQVMLEIEEDKKVKSTWAKALAQSEGDKNKAEALYIKSRVETIQNEQNKILKLKEEQEQERQRKIAQDKKGFLRDELILEIRKKYNIANHEKIDSNTDKFILNNSPLDLYINWNGITWELTQK